MMFTVKRLHTYEGDWGSPIELYALRLYRFQGWLPKRAAWRTGDGTVVPGFGVGWAWWLLGWKRGWVVR